MIAMSQKFTLDNKEYDIDTLDESSKAKIASLNFVSAKIQELTNMQAVLQRAKNSYVDSLKKEMLSDKAGFLFGED